MGEATLRPSAGVGPAAEGVAALRTGRRWPGVLAVLVTVLAAYTLIALIGVREDARDERILGSLSPVFLWLRDNGAAAQQWMQQNRTIVGRVGSGLLSAVALAALISRGRRAAPVVLLTVAFGLAGWAQVAVQGKDTSQGLYLYLAAVAAALGLGLWCPLRRLATFPPFPPDRAAPRRGLTWGWECVLVLGLTLVALVSRTWALTELYDFFDLETIDWIVQGRTWFGYLGYLDYGFVQNNGGAVQFLPTQVILRLFGTSIFTLRMTAVLWAIAAVPLMYTLGRRLGGVTTALLASVFFITAPEQLFWARNENLHFAPMAVCALLTAHLALWMVERLSPLAVLLNALWMPWCRWFYSACMVAFLIPIATGLHALIFGRRLWRKVWYVVPLLAGGLLLWIFSLTVMKASLHNWQWQFVDPSAVYGASAWRKQGEFRDASMSDLARLQAVSMSTNFATVLRNMSDNTENFSHWCQRSQPADHRTILNIGLTLIVFVGLGYLLAQFHDRRAFVLLAWWGISVLPAILSQDPADRRMAMVFPASHALAATVLGAFLHLVGERGGRLAEALAGVTTVLGCAAIALTNLASHLLLPINPVLYSDYPKFTRPLLEGSDATFTNIPGPFRTLSVFGNLDHFLESPTCLQYIEPQHWLETLLNPRCAFDDSVYRITVGDAVIERLRQTYQPKRISYLLTDEPSSAPQIALLRALHPDAALISHPVPRAERTLVAMTVGIDEVNKLRTPSLIAAGAVPAEILAGVPLQRESPPSGDAPAALTVEGGILVDTDGWYRWQVDPPCADAALSIGGSALPGEAVRPMLAGVHPFTLTVPPGDACGLPMRIVMDGVVPHRTEPVPPERYVSRTVAALPEVRAPRVEAFAGYAPPAQAMQFRARPVDFGIDAQGNISVLMHEGETHRIRRFDPAGKELAAWDIPVPLTINPAAIAVAPDGSTAVLVQRTIHLYDPQGKEIATWDHPWFVWETQLAFWGGNLVANIHHRNAIAVFTPKGELVKEFTTFQGGPGSFYAPMAFGLDIEGNLLVQQLDGQALRFHLDGSEFAPVFIEEFRVDAAAPGSGFDGPDRMLVPSEHGLRVFGPGGVRLLATDPARDLSQQALGSALRIHRADGRLFILDSDRLTLWTISG